MKDDILTLQEAARYLSVKAVTLRKWDNEGQLKALRIGLRGDRRYKKSDLDEMINRQTQPIKWQEMTRGSATYRHLAPGIYGMTDGLEQLFGRGFARGMAYFEGDMLYWYYDPVDVYQVGQIIIKKILSSKREENEFFVTWNERAEALASFIDKHKPLDFKTLNDYELAAVAIEQYHLAAMWYGISMSIDATDETMMADIVERLQKLLQQELGTTYSNKEFNKIYGELSQPSYLSYISVERLLLLELAQEIKTKKLQVNDIVFIERCQQVSAKYWWTELSWARGAIKTVESIVEGVMEIVNSNTDIEAEIKRLKSYAQEISKNKATITAKYNIGHDHELFEWLRLNDILVEYHDLRKEMQMKLNYWQYALLDEIARRTKMPVHLLEWCEATDLSKLITSKSIDETEINRRSDKFIYLKIGDKVEKLSGKQATALHQLTVGSMDSGAVDFQGMSASGGRVIGEAFVALSSEAAKGIKAGQILVTGMTTPDFVPAMKKASAIVTDEGGITCHAAIISRELGIPCIVGTRQATRLIKTGDQILVAANHGVVRIISK